MLSSVCFLVTSRSVFGALPFNVRGFEALLLVVVFVVAATSRFTAVNTEEYERQENDHSTHNGANQIFLGHMVWSKNKEKQTRMLGSGGGEFRERKTFLSFFAIFASSHNYHFLE